MAARSACLALAVLTAVTPVHQTLSGHEPHHRDLEILVDGWPQHQYAHGGRVYVEAIQGREYTIRLRNPYPVRVAVALSVDGLNTIDARHTTAPGARKWVLGPYQTMDVVGWQTSRNQARRFEFTTEEKSYGQALGAIDNLGVMSAVFFKERSRPVAAERSFNSSARRQEPPPAAAAPVRERQPADSSTAMKAADEYAATGMGDATHNPVSQVWMDLETAPARTVNIRYEYRPQLVKLGVLPEAAGPDSLARRERARGFEPGFSPVPR